ncbi:hypothetical protein BDU57DRAFT_526248 [Ampelomyces quisqualis]|uniref:Uncharacterized protein n=1 Tax=Ampelomyces quisqualis TaxID=50730 RepID=A0A6A5R145_AMPQU|nr:hypothetical protein BDU57DRAFT_526248 [Ampelomyces quisqualis]
MQGHDADNPTEAHLPRSDEESNVTLGRHGVACCGFVPLSSSSMSSRRNSSVRPYQDGLVHFIMQHHRDHRLHVLGHCQREAGLGLCVWSLGALPPVGGAPSGFIGADHAQVAGVYFAVLVRPVGGGFAAQRADIWRYIFYAPAIANFFSFLGLYFFYYPPKYLRGLPTSQASRELDYVRTILFIASTTLILAGVVYTTTLPSSPVTRGRSSPHLSS